MARLFILMLVLFFSARMAWAGEYTRTDFKHWSDMDGDGRDSRQEVLAAANIGIICPYTGELITDVSRIDIDHVVPLAYAWNHGAEPWSAARKEQFANDPENLIAVSADVNRAKGARPPAEWLPPNLRYVPRYIERFTKICVKYSLDCDFVGLGKQFDEYSKVRNGVRP